MRPHVGLGLGWNWKPNGGGGGGGNWNLGGGDPVPPGLANQGYGAELVWNVDDLGLIEGHVYRVQVMVHDAHAAEAGSAGALRR